jgi:hypothetical protein
LTVKHPASTTGAMLTPFEEGFLVGILVGEGHFGGDGRKAQVTLRMHVRHEKLFRWLERALPRGRLYGPYDHGGRRYFQWMLRGPAIAEDLLPLLAAHPEVLDDHVLSRIEEMCVRYRLAWTG